MTPKEHIELMMEEKFKMKIMEWYRFPNDNNINIDIGIFQNQVTFLRALLTLKNNGSFVIYLESDFAGKVTSEGIE